MGAAEVPTAGISLPSGFSIVCTTNKDRNLPVADEHAYAVLVGFNEET